MKPVSKSRAAKKWKVKDPPLKIQVEYYRALAKYTAQVGAVFEEEVFPVALQKADELSATDVGTHVGTDTEGDTITAALNRFLKRATELSRTAVNKAAIKMVGTTEVFQRNLFVTNVKNSIGVDIAAIVSRKQVKTEIDKAVITNFDLIKSIKKSYYDRGRAIIEKGLREGQSRKTLEQNLLNLGGFDERYKGTEQRRARTIARDQSQKFAKSIDTARQKKLGVRKFDWINSADSRVRDDHSEWGNHRFEYSDPPNGELPGDAVNCRCHARPALDELLASLEGGNLS